MSDDESELSTIEDINSGLLQWWKENPKQAKKVARVVVESGINDTYFEGLDFWNSGVIIRVLTYLELTDPGTEPAIELAIDRLRTIFCTKISLSCCVVVRDFGDEV